MTSRVPATAVAVVVALAIGCSKSSPTQPDQPGSPSSGTAPARVIDALTGQPIAGVTASGTEITGGPSSTAGTMTVTAASSSSNARSVTFTVSGYVNRSVAMKISGTEVTVSMIPSSFNLNAFDELARTPLLRRWAAVPALRVQARTLTFTNVDQADGVAEDDVMSDAHRAQLEADMVFGLQQLSGQTYQAFAGTTRETAAVGERVSILNTGSITVVLMRGLRTQTGFAGYGRWQFRNDGTVVGGAVMLDRDLDLSGPALQRAIRVHELGHAMGYDHVTSTTSLMGPSGAADFTQFDRDAMKIVFLRPPGNVRPDADPSSASLNALGEARWSRGAGLRRP